MSKQPTPSEFEARVGPKRRNAIAGFVVLFAMAFGIFYFDGNPPSDAGLIALAVLDVLVLLFAWYPYMRVVNEIGREIKKNENKKNDP